METAKQTKFFYKGPISSSKSLINRALLARSFFPKLTLHGSSTCEDVRHMITAVRNFPTQREIQCGDAGTVLRFMAMRASREPGVTVLTGSARLFQRPQDDLLFVLNQLGVRAETLGTRLTLESNGWKRPLMPLKIHREKSSQFATGLLFSSWNLPFPLEFELVPKGKRDSYWVMSLAFAESLGMIVENKSKDHFIIPPAQEVAVSQATIEPDYSSMFAIAAMAALAGEARLEGVGATSLQPDYEFIEILKKLKVPIALEGTTLSVLKAPSLAPIDVIMRDTPDLFPVLAVLLAHAEGRSSLTGAPRLIYKESNRIKKTAELLKLMQVDSEITDDGLVIKGRGQGIRIGSFAFDPDEDHRMVMAAGILMRMGWKIDLQQPELVNKSFPEFWRILGLKP